jgi:hypothetical protein
MSRRSGRDALANAGVPYYAKLLHPRPFMPADQFTHTRPLRNRAPGHPRSCRRLLLLLVLPDAECAQGVGHHLAVLGARVDLDIEDP